VAPMAPATGTGPNFMVVTALGCEDD